MWPCKLCLPSSTWNSNRQAGSNIGSGKLGKVTKTVYNDCNLPPSVWETGRQEAKATEAESYDATSSSACEETTSIVHDTSM
eukprot:767471-Hanusia_phi.AAC.8